MSNSPLSNSDSIDVSSDDEYIPIKIPRQAKVTRRRSKARREPEPLIEPEPPRPNKTTMFLTRKELMEFRNDIYGLTIPRVVEPKKSEKPKKLKPGRKVKTAQERGLEVNDFGEEIPSDMDSDFEGYISDGEDARQPIPRLKRSTSSESLFLDPRYEQHRFNMVNWIHGRKIWEARVPLAKKRSRKMSRIAQKHVLRHMIIENENLNYKEMIECYHQTLPNMKEDKANIKVVMRAPFKAPKFNMKRIYTYGEVHIVDAVADLLSEMVSEIVAGENASRTMGNRITQCFQNIRVRRHQLLSNLPTLPTNHPKKYLALELLTLSPIDTDFEMEHYKRALLSDLTEKVNSYLSQPRYIQLYNLRMRKIHELEEDFEDYWRKELLRLKRSDNSLKVVLDGVRTLRANTKKKQERQEMRKAWSRVSTQVRNGMSNEDAEQAKKAVRERIVKEREDRENGLKALEPNSTRAELREKLLEEAKEKGRLRMLEVISVMEFKARAERVSERINLLTVAKKEGYGCQRKAFRELDKLELMKEKEPKFTKVLVDKLRIPRGDIIKCLMNLVENRSPPIQVPLNYLNLIQNISKCFICDCGVWMFELSMNTIFDGIPDEMRNFIEFKMNF